MAVSTPLLLLVALLFCVGFSVANAQDMPLVSAALGPNMVLQQAPQSANLWGWTPAAGQTVTVQFNGQTYTSQASGSDSLWVVSLPPMAASLTPYTIVVTSQDGSQSVTLDNVLFGDVFVCGGQSNMQFTVNLGYNYTTEIEDANNYPNIRLFTVGQNNISYEPLANFASVEQGWSVASNTTVGGPGWGYFSAVCWFFVRNLYDTQQIPIGAISSNWGGTYIQAWSSPDALAMCPNSALESPAESPVAQKFFAGGVNDNPNQNSVLWNAMIVPLLPMRVRGSIWYQAEANIGQPSYACMFPAMIEDWRAKWGLSAEEFGFYFAQLAPYTEGYTTLNVLPDMRLYQTRALDLQYTGMATTIDAGDLNSPQGNIHPENKQVVGYRLSLAARQQLYGEADLVISGPVFDVAVIASGPPNPVVQVSFQPSTIAAGLVLRDDVFCPVGQGNPAVNLTTCAWYELQTADTTWNNATVAIGPSNSLLLSLNTTQSVIGVRYAYNWWPVATLYNSLGLPAPPFYAIINE